MTRHARTGFHRCGASPPQLSSDPLGRTTNMIQERLKTLFGKYPVEINDGYSKYSIYQTESQSLVFEDKSLTIKERLPAIIISSMILIWMVFRITKTELYYLLPIVAVLFWFSWRFRPKKVIVYDDKMEIEFKSFMGYKRNIVYKRSEISTIEATPIKYSSSNQFLASITIHFLTGKKRNLLSINTSNSESSGKISDSVAQIFNLKLGLPHKSQANT